MSKQQELLREFSQFAASAPSAAALMSHIAQRLHEEQARYNWVGFYLVDKADEQMLVVGPYVGSFNPHPRIPFNKGMCGAAATGRKTIVANNVAKDPTYLAGSEMVKASVVVPILARNELVAELDIESYFADTFTRVEQAFAESIGELVGKYLEQKR